jgi:hypothetical protein
VAQVSIGGVENLEDLVSGLVSVREALESSCREQIAVAQAKSGEARAETQASEALLNSCIEKHKAAHQRVEETRQILESAIDALSSAESMLSACHAGPRDENGNPPDCSCEAADVAASEVAVGQAQADVGQADAASETAQADVHAMERRVECARHALGISEVALETLQGECAVRLAAVSLSVDTGKARLAAAQQALNAYLDSHPAAAEFAAWLKWSPESRVGPITPDTLRDRMNLSAQQRQLFQEYLYEREPAYRRAVDKYRTEWAACKGDAERNIVARKARIHLSGQFAEHIARQAIAPLGERVETQGRTFVGDGGRYTKTDLIVTGLRAPVILGRGEGMGAPIGGCLAFEVKCGRASYLYAQKDHMVFQAEGHKQANAKCTICSRDLHDLPPEREKELRDTLRDAGSPLVGMLPRKNDIDSSCLTFIREDRDGKT